MAVTHRSMWLGTLEVPQIAEALDLGGHQVEARDGLLGAIMIDKHRISPSLFRLDRSVAGGNGARSSPAP